MHDIDESQISPNHQIKSLINNTPIQLKVWYEIIRHTISDASMPISVSVSVLFLVLSVCISKATNAHYQPIFHDITLTWWTEQIKPE